MIKQTLFFTTPASLSLRNSQMVISRKDFEDVTRPIEDIGCVVLENQMIRVTLPLLNELVKNNVAVIICDQKLMPSAMLQCLEGNTTQAESLKLQLSASEPMKKQAWKQIIEAKIRNQASVLQRQTPMGGDVLRPFYSNVKSADSDNREAVAAKIYWSQLFGKEFKREREGCAPNALLNYGYALLRAATARALVGSGLLPALGIFHKSRYNAFPLADDVMEPFRPFVDEMVFNLCCQGTPHVTKDTKGALMRVLSCDVKMDKVTRPLQIALTFTTASLVKYYAGETKKLSLPTL